MNSNSLIAAAAAFGALLLIAVASAEHGLRGGLLIVTTIALTTIALVALENRP